MFLIVGGFASRFVGKGCSLGGMGPVSIVIRIVMAALRGRFAIFVRMALCSLIILVCSVDARLLVLHVKAL
jgi:hypothetical protein